MRAQRGHASELIGRFDSLGDQLYVVWSDTVGVAIPAPTEFTSAPGLAVGGNSLLVPAGHRLVCYR